MAYSKYLWLKIFPDDLCEIRPIFILVSRNFLIFFQYLWLKCFSDEALCNQTRPVVTNRFTIVENFPTRLQQSIGNELLAGVISQPVTTQS